MSKFLDQEHWGHSDKNNDWFHEPFDFSSWEDYWSINKQKTIDGILLSKALCIECKFINIRRFIWLIKNFSLEETWVRK